MLRSCRCGFSFDHFLDALNATTRLEVLVLDSFLERIEGDWTRGPALARTPLSMLQLKSLELAHHPLAHTSRFLSHAQFSPTVSSCIDCEVNVPLEADFTESISAVLPSNPAAVFPGLALAKEVTVVVHGMEYSLSCSPRPDLGERPLVSFDIECFLLSEWNGFSHHGARDLLSLFASAPLTTLDFTGECSDVPEAIWAEIFSKYPLLETLRLAQADTTETVFAGLVAAAPPQDSPAPCPSLQSVSVGGLFFEEALDVLVQCLRDRGGKGYRLKYVQMELLGDEDEAERMDTDYMPALRELVADATCEFNLV